MIQDAIENDSHIFFKVSTMIRDSFFTIIARQIEGAGIFIRGKTGATFKLIKIDYLLE
jgi:hypothetical protein